jgi:hypothetical protein
LMPAGSATETRSVAPAGAAVVSPASMPLRAEGSLND